MADIYRYAFSSSGLASTTGRLELMLGEASIDEVCWGKTACVRGNSKFDTAESKNLSLVRHEDGFIQAKYLPEPAQSLKQKEEPKEQHPSCENVIITEYYAYYDINSDQQFIELYNKTDDSQALDGCILRYKNHIFQLEGQLEAGEYYAFYHPDLKLTKSPSSEQKIELIDYEDNIIDSVIQSTKQNKARSYILMAGENGMEWRQTYNITPAKENIYQEFMDCPAGKTVNPITGYCVNEEAKATSVGTICPEGKYLNILTGRCKNKEIKTVKTCKTGYYLNPETNRCKKNAAEKTPATCKEGYERNPDTNRCRKIAKNQGDEYAVEDIEPNSGSYDSPKIFIATGSIIVLATIGVGIVIYQYRKELKKRIIRIWRRRKSSV